MAEEFGFFDPVEIAPNVFDREYNAEQFTKYFRALVTTGIMKGEVGELKVSANGANMIVAIDTGVAFIEGSYYRNTVSLPHTLDTESLGRSRIDRVVVRLDMAERKVTSFVKKGVPSSSPVAPTLTQTANLYEISLAQVKVVGGQTYVNVPDVVDERGKDVICPWAGSNILPNFDDAALAELMANQLTDGPRPKEYQGHLNDLREMGFYYADGAFVAKGYPREVNNAHRVLIEVFRTGDSWLLQRFTWWDNSPGAQVYQRGLYVGDNWSTWVLMNPANYNRLDLQASAGWTAPYSGSIHLLRWGDVITVYGSIKLNSASSYKQMTQIPLGYRVTYALVPFTIYGNQANGTPTTFGGVMGGDGSVAIESIPVSGLSTTSQIYFSFSYILPR